MGDNNDMEVERNLYNGQLSSVALDIDISEEDSIKLKLAADLSQLKQTSDINYSKCVKIEKLSKSEKQIAFSVEINRYLSQRSDENNWTYPKYTTLDKGFIKVGEFNWADLDEENRISSYCLFLDDHGIEKFFSLCNHLPLLFRKKSHLVFAYTYALELSGKLSERERIRVLPNLMDAIDAEFPELSSLCLDSFSSNCVSTYIRTRSEMHDLSLNRNKQEVFFTDGWQTLIRYFSDCANYSVENIELFNLFCSHMCHLYPESKREILSVKTQTIESALTYERG